ncbi:MAG: glycosyltransferase [Candidatus Microsaccharimonas sp.]
MIPIPAQLLLIIAVTVILLVTLIVTVVRDIKAIRTNRTIQRALLAAGKLRAQKKISVIITLGKRADSIVPLLDRLLEQHYKKLEVIIVIKHTAGKNARTQLNAYKKKNTLALRIVSYKAGMTIRDIAHRYASGALVMTLSVDTQLSRDLFTQVSIDAFVSKADVIIPARYAQLDNTITRAILSFDSDRFAVGDTSETSGLIYKRQSFIASPQRQLRIQKSNTAYILDAHTHKIRLQERLVRERERTWLFVASTLALMLLIAYLVIVDPTSRIIVVTIITGGLLFLYASTVLSTRAYSVVEKISLLLLFPIYIGYRLIVRVIAVATVFRPLPRRSRLVRKQHS